MLCRSSNFISLAMSYYILKPIDAHPGRILLINSFMCYAVAAINQQMSFVRRNLKDPGSCSGILPV